VCVGLVVKKQPVVGVVYNPVSKELFSAVDGGGAYLSVDGASPMRIRPSAVAQVPRSHASSKRTKHNATLACRFVLATRIARTRLPCPCPAASKPGLGF
jgi:fructose-1,6-bisphosphatase/inositol monophosphatase family enzyme